MEDNTIKHPLIIYILKHWLINLILFLLLDTAIFIKIFFYTDKKYTANVSVIPSAANFSQGLANQLGAIAGLAGLNMPSASGQSQEMFRGILLSNRVLETVLFDTFTTKQNSLAEQTLLIRLLKLKAISASDSLEKGLKEMRNKVISIDINPDNDILILHVTLGSPYVAAEVANEMVALLDDIVQNQVQKEYRQQLSYLNNRISETEINLKLAEDNLQQFLERIRNIKEPRNQIEEIRHRREVELQTVIYTELQKQKETYILQNMINLSSIKVLDKAVPPFRKSRPKRLLLLISLGMLEVCCQIGFNAGILMIRKVKRDYTRQKSVLEC
jgi:uncharacterized protein involved in exopolysaccharide biosynthesis